MATQRSMYQGSELYAWRADAANRTKAIDVDKWGINQNDILHLPGAGPQRTVTIADNAIIPQSADIKVDTEGGAPADDLSSMAQGDLHAGMEARLVSADASRAVTVRHSTAPSGIQTLDGQDIALDPQWPLVVKLVSTEALTFWKEIPGPLRIRHAAQGMTVPLEEFRLSWIAVPRPWRSTTLPANHIWATGDLVLFEDWPEFAEVYASGGFGGMLLEADADDSLTATYPGRWKKHLQGLGLYAPILGGQFLRAWSQGQSMDADREAGARQGDAIRNITGDIQIHYNLISSTSGALTQGGTGTTAYVSGNSSLTGSTFGHIDASRVVPTAAETRPYNIAVPMIIYLGQPAGV